MREDERDSKDKLDKLDFLLLLFLLANVLDSCHRVHCLLDHKDGHGECLEEIIKTSILLAKIDIQLSRQKIVLHLANLR